VNAADFKPAIFRVRHQPVSSVRDTFQHQVSENMMQYYYTWTHDWRGMGLSPRPVSAFLVKRAIHVWMEGVV
jgi:hypothetical protein